MPTNSGKAIHEYQAKLLLKNNQEFDAHNCCAAYLNNKADRYMTDCTDKDCQKTHPVLSTFKDAWRCSNMAFPARGFKCLTQGRSQSHAQPKTHRVDGNLGKFKQTLLNAGYHTTTSPQYANVRTHTHSQDRSVTFNIPDAARSVQNADNSIQSEVNAAAQTIAPAAEKLSALVESAAQLLP